ncbi:MAG: hypothetical protein AAF228_05365 [Pseudomonadota bacterium]
MENINNINPVSSNSIGYEDGVGDVFQDALQGQAQLAGVNSPSPEDVANANILKFVLYFNSGINYISSNNDVSSLETIEFAEVFGFVRPYGVTDLEASTAAGDFIIALTDGSIEFPDGTDPFPGDQLPFQNNT